MNYRCLESDIDRCDAQTLDIEIFPNRPDLLSGETLTRAIRNFVHRQPAKPSITTTEGKITLNVEPDLAEIRPVILGAVVRNVDYTSIGVSADEFTIINGPPRETSLLRWVEVVNEPQ